MKVFDKYWFIKHQRPLLWLANSWLGKFVFQFKKMGHYLEHRIVKITPNSVAELLEVKDDEVVLKEHFFSRNEYARKLYYVLLPMWYVMHIWDLLADLFVPELSFGFSTLTVNPGSIGTDNPVAGQVARIGDDVTFANIRSAVGNSHDYTSAGTHQFMLFCSATTNQFASNYRYLAFFDTSSLTAGATISAAVESLYGQVIRNNIAGTAFDAHLASGNAASTSALADADYAQANFGTTSFGSIVNASLVTAAYNDLTLNGTGLASISKTGITKHSWQTSWDINNNFNGTWTDSGNSGLVFDSADSTPNKPKLVITYSTAGAGGSSNLSLLGVG